MIVPVPGPTRYIVLDHIYSNDLIKISLINNVFNSLHTNTIGRDICSLLIIVLKDSELDN